MKLYISVASKMSKVRIAPECAKEAALHVLARLVHGFSQNNNTQSLKEYAKRKYGITLKHLRGTTIEVKPLICVGKLEIEKVVLEFTSDTPPNKHMLMGVDPKTGGIYVYMEEQSHFFSDLLDRYNQKKALDIFYVKTILNFVHEFEHVVQQRFRVFAKKGEHPVYRDVEVGPYINGLYLEEVMPYIRSIAEGAVEGEPSEVLRNFIRNLASTNDYLIGLKKHNPKAFKYGVRLLYLRGQTLLEKLI